MYVFDSLYKRRKAAYSAIDLIKNFVYQKYKAENTGKFRRFKCVKIKASFFVLQIFSFVEN